MANITRKKPNVAAIMARARNATAKRKEAEEKLESSLSPMEVVLWTLAGAGAAGAAEAFFRPETVDTVKRYGSIAAILSGSVGDSAHAVAFGAGLGAAEVKSAVKQMLTATPAPGAAAPALETTASPMLELVPEVAPGTEAKQPETVGGTR